MQIRCGLSFTTLKQPLLTSGPQVAPQYIRSSGLKNMVYEFSMIEGRFRLHHFKLVSPLVTKGIRGGMNKKVGNKGRILPSLCGLF